MDGRVIEVSYAEGMKAGQPFPDGGTTKQKVVIFYSDETTPEEAFAQLMSAIQEEKAVRFARRTLHGHNPHTNRPIQRTDIFYY